MIRRREFITLLGGATLACPLAARAQQPPMPVIGFLQRSKPVRTDFADFRDGLKALGYEEGRNIRVEQRYAGRDIDVLRAFTQELVGMNVKVIVIDGFATIHTVMAATKTIPIVSALIAGPDQFGIASLARPGGNLTGISWFGALLAGKGLGLLHELVPNAIALLANPKLPESARMVSDAQEAARTLSLQLLVLNASTPSETNTAFATLRQQRAGALLVGSDPFLTGRRQQIVALAARDAIPDMYLNREFVEDGGLMSYGNDTADAYRRPQ